jgi:hypothetical protein
MTLFRLQTIEVPNVEEEIERAYFEWGRGWEPKSPDPDWAAATPEQRRCVALRGYRLYDGLPVRSGSRIDAVDAYVSIGINSRITLYDAVRFMSRAGEAEPLLARVPDNAILEHATDDQIAAAAETIDLFSGEFQINRGKATKVLHRRRPAFIPVLDSVVDDFLWKNFPHVRSGGSPTLDVLRLFRSLLMARAHRLGGLQAALAERGLDLSTARLLDFVIWCKWKGRVDKFGFGPSITQVWHTSSLPEARIKARKSWAEQEHED